MDCELPLVLAVGTGVVMVSYLLLNFVFLSVAPVDATVGKIEIGYIAAHYAFGEVGAAIMGVTLALLLISTVSAMIIAAPRVLQVVGEDFHVFRLLGRVNKHNIPATAVYFQGITTLLFMWTASFDSILVFSGVTMALNTLFAVVGLFVLRRRDKIKNNTEQVTFQIPLYPLPPLIFIAVTGWTLVYLAIERPVEVFFGVCVIAIGAIGYLIARRWDVQLER